MRARAEAARKRALAGASFEFDDGFELGFRIAPDGTTYHFDFDKDGFQEVFLEFLAPRFRECFMEEPQHTEEG